jgi:hypothetical protein
MAVTRQRCELMVNPGPKAMGVLRAGLQAKRLRFKT